MIFQALIKSDKVQLSDLPESGHSIGTALRYTHVKGGFSGRISEESPGSLGSPVDL